MTSVGEAEVQDSSVMNDDSRENEEQSGPGEQPPGEEQEANAEQGGSAGEGDEASEAAGDEPQPAEEATAELAVDVTALQEEAARNHDRFVRSAADFENYRRRARRDLKLAVEQAEEKVVLRFLPIMDNLERAISHAPDDSSGEGAKSVLDGVKMVCKQFAGALAQYEIAAFESVGQVFDPEHHEAIQQRPSDEPRNTVIIEVQKGYSRADRLVRPAMVVVSQGPEEQPSPGADDESDPQREVAAAESSNVADADEADEE